MIFKQKTTPHQQDLKKIEAITLQKSEEAQVFQDQVSLATQNNDRVALQVAVQQIEKYVLKFNQELDALDLQTSEGQAIREQLKVSNSVGIELAAESLKDKPDLYKLSDLKMQTHTAQESMQKHMEALKALQ